jgi:hypothetical protein
MSGKRKPWRETYSVHPAADLFPMMSDAELEELGADIKRNGLSSPITLWTDNREWAAAHHPGKFDEKDTVSPVYLLDGRNRLEAMARAGIDPASVHMTTRGGFRQYAKAMQAQSEMGVDDWKWVPEMPDPVAYVMSANIQRRHLTSAQKRSLIAKLLKIAPELSDGQVAKDVGAHHTTVSTVRHEQEASGETSHVDTHTDSKGRKQPARKAKPKPAPAAAPAAVQPEPTDDPTGLPGYGRRKSKAPEDMFARVVHDLAFKVDLLVTTVDINGITATPIQIRRLAHILHALGKVRRTVEGNARRAKFHADADTETARIGGKPTTNNFNIHRELN